MKVGKIYKFFGEFEQGEFVVGKFEGFEDGTGFMKFSDVVRNKHCNPSYRPDTIELIAMHLDKDDKGKNWRDYEDEDKEYIKSMFRIQLFVVNEPRYK